ncbi:MAG: glycosyltransferase family 4 protein [Gemmatimonas sp.]
MRILFIHQNMPGQFKHLAQSLAADRRNQVVFVTKRPDVQLPNVAKAQYTPPRAAAEGTHHYLRSFENAVLYGQCVARVGMELKRKGFVPDVVVAHPGWGESLFVRDVFPDARILNFCEFYYHAFGADTNFDPAFPLDPDDVFRVRMRNSHLLHALESCDWGISPTEWQKAQHPPEFRDKISVIFDGIDTDAIRPDPQARFALPDGRELKSGDPVVTYVSRNLEPYRGFPYFIRALPEILRRRSDAEVVVLGGDDVSYGRPPKEGGCWREAMLKEVPLDPGRVHFLGRVPYARYLDLLRVSAAHVYLTVPFVLSWSMIEAMSAGCLIVGSSTPPVREVIEDGRNGVLVDFFSVADVADRVVDALDDPARFAAIRDGARRTAIERYDVKRCLAAQRALIDRLAAGERPSASSRAQ